PTPRRGWRSGGSGRRGDPGRPAIDRTAGRPPASRRNDCMVALAMPESVRLAGAGGRPYDYTPTGRFLYADGGAPPKQRLPYAAVHVVADAMADTSPVSPAAVDWER